MNGADLKSWRKRIGYTQEEAAREFGVSRPTVQNWEYENTSVPLVVELASHRLLRQWKQRREYGPVFLIYFDLQNRPPETLCCFRCADNASAFRKIAECTIGIETRCLLIIDEDNQVIWSGVSLHSDVEKDARSFDQTSR